jgi:hypothetical protein
MRTSLLRGFFPTAKAPAFENADGRIIKLAGGVEEVFGCSESLTFNFRGELLSACVTRVQPGDRVVLKRGDGQRDISESFDKEGILLSIPVPARPEMLRGLRGRPIPLCIDFQGTSGAWRNGCNGRHFFLATGARIAGVSLAATPEEADCELSLID